MKNNSITGFIENAIRQDRKNSLVSLKIIYLYKIVEDITATLKY